VPTFSLTDAPVAHVIYIYKAMTPAEIMHAIKKTMAR
jgi:hypothetical protein